MPFVSGSRKELAIQLPWSTNHAVVVVNVWNTFHKQIKAIDEIGAVERVASDSNTKSLAKTNLMSKEEDCFLWSLALAKFLITLRVSRIRLHVFKLDFESEIRSN